MSFNSCQIIFLKYSSDAVIPWYLNASPFIGYYVKSKLLSLVIKICYKFNLFSSLASTTSLYQAWGPARLTYIQTYFPYFSLSWLYIHCSPSGMFPNILFLSSKSFMSIKPQLKFWNYPWFHGFIQPLQTQDPDRPW